MSSVATLTELTLAQRRELLKMARAPGLVEGRSELPPIERTPRDERLRLSCAQERLWFIDRMEPGSAICNLPVACGEAGAGAAGAAGAAVGTRGDGSFSAGTEFPSQPLADVAHAAVIL
jgi:hypothetical protein